MSVAEFIELRESIEALAGQITVSVKDKNVEDSKKRLEEANEKLDRLKTMVSTDVQVIVSERLTRQLTGLSAKVETMAAKKPVRKTSARKKAVKKEPKQ
jgi:thioester reductase-like protein